MDLLGLVVWNFITLFQLPCSPDEHRNGRGYLIIPRKYLRDYNYYVEHLCCKNQNLPCERRLVVHHKVFEVWWGLAMALRLSETIGPFDNVVGPASVALSSWKTSTSWNCRTLGLALLSVSDNLARLNARLCVFAAWWCRGRKFHWDETGNWFVRTSFNWYLVTIDILFINAAL